jgi:salicylate hydroxylase
VKIQPQDNGDVRLQTTLRRIVGAGLVGSAAVLSLSRLDNVQVTAFEKSPVAREAGAWISLTVTGQKVLTKLVPPHEINAIAYRPPDKAVYVTRHWKTGESLIRRYSSEDLKEDYIQARTHRAPLLQLLLAHHPAGSVQYGSRISDINVQGAEAVLRADDGSTAGTYDLVVAADGLYSGIRRKFWPEHKVGYRGAVAYRCVFDKSRVAHIAELHDDSSSWSRNGEIVFLSELGLGQYGVVIIRAETPEHAASLRWERSIGAGGLERLRGLYGHWDPVIGRVLDAVDDIQAYPLESGPWLRQLSKEERVAFIGDAAHPTAGAYGAGAAMGFCDGWALYRALQGTRRRVGTQASSVVAATGYDVPAALHVFEETRLPYLLRVERQIAFDAQDKQYVAEAGNGDSEEWVARLKETAGLFNQWLTEHDVELEVQKALMSWDRHRDYSQEAAPRAQL